MLFQMTPVRFLSLCFHWRKLVRVHFLWLKPFALVHHTCNSFQSFQRVKYLQEMVKFKPKNQLRWFVHDKQYIVMVGTASLKRNVSLVWGHEDV